MKAYRRSVAFSALSEANDKCVIGGIRKMGQRAHKTGPRDRAPPITNLRLRVSI
jgi:hypothetical protein